MPSGCPSGVPWAPAPAGASDAVAPPARVAARERERAGEHGQGKDGKVARAAVHGPVQNAGTVPERIREGMKRTFLARSGAVE